MAVNGPGGPASLRLDRAGALLVRSKTLDDIAAIVALEAWSQGAQAIFVDIAEREDAGGAV